jgi:hypothetical protein
MLTVVDTFFTERYRLFMVGYPKNNEERLSRIYDLLIIRKNDQPRVKNMFTDGRSVRESFLLQCGKQGRMRTMECWC